VSTSFFISNGCWFSLFHFTPPSLKVTLIKITPLCNDFFFPLSSGLPSLPSVFPSTLALAYGLPDCIWTFLFHVFNVDRQLSTVLGSVVLEPSFFSKGGLFSSKYFPLALFLTIQLPFIFSIIFPPSFPPN